MFATDPEGVAAQDHVTRKLVELLRFVTWG